jgi:hypothetical protein
MRGDKSELEAISSVVSTFRIGEAAARKRLTKAIELMISATGGRFHEAVDVRLSQLERDFDQHSGR